MTLHEASIFSAGQDAGARVAAGVARLAAIELLEDARWWNRWRRRLLARALTSLAEEVEETADGAAPARRPTLVADDASRQRPRATSA